MLGALPGGYPPPAPSLLSLPGGCAGFASTALSFSPNVDTFAWPEVAAANTSLGLSWSDCGGAGYQVRRHTSPAGG